MLYNRENVGMKFFLKKSLLWFYVTREKIECKTNIITWIFRISLLKSAVNI